MDAIEPRAGATVPVGPGRSTVLADFDFETYSEAGYKWATLKGKPRLAALDGITTTKRGLEVVGVRNYVRHPTFEILCLAYNLKDGEGPRLWLPSDDLVAYGVDDRHPLDLLAHVATGGHVEGWNSGGFEFEVWNQYCVPRWKWPELKVEQLHDAMAKAAVWAIPRGLENASGVLNLVNKKDSEGKRLLKKFSVPRNPTISDTRTRIRPVDDIEGVKLFGYCLQDIAAESEASLMCPDLTEFEREVWETDLAINQRGMRVDLRAVEDCIAVYEQAVLKLNAELQAITGGISASEVAQLGNWLRGRGYGFYSMEAEVLEDALSRRDHYPPDVYRAIEIRYFLSAASVKKLYAFKHQANEDERMRGLYAYFAARTGRWNGYGPQPMNLYKGKRSVEDCEKILEAMRERSVELIELLFGDPIEAIMDCMRALIVAAPGHEFICSDYSAIEGVVTAALAGEEWRLEVFRTHGMIYEASASAICGIPFEEFVRHKAETKQHHPMRNKIGKFAELACGFGGWIGAMKGFGADEFMNDDELKQAVLGWRAASPNIVEFWGGQTRDKFRPSCRPELYGVEGAAIMAVLHHGQAFAYKQVVYQCIGDVLYCQVPSGGLLVYHRPRLNPSTRDYAESWEQELSYEGWNSNPKQGPIGWTRMSLYGGKQTENIVQKVARAIQARALVRLNRAGYRPVMHTHDEAAGEVPAGTGSIEEFEALMNAHEAWAVDCKGVPMPVRAKGGWRGYRFRKD